MNSYFNNIKTKTIIFCITVCIVLSSVTPILCSAETDYSDDFDWNKVNTITASDIISYYDYYAEYNSADCPPDEIELPISKANLSNAPSSRIENNYAGRSGAALYQPENDTVSWDFSVKKSGLYCLYFEYYTVEGAGDNIERSVKIDNEAPFVEAQNLAFSRIWGDATDKPETDTQGNEIMITQIEKPSWTWQFAEDPSGINREPFCFYLSAGEHNFKLEGAAEPAVWGKICFKSVLDTRAKEYETVVKAYENTAEESDLPDIVLQAEDADIKSSQMLYPVSDRTSPTVEPYSAYKIVYNSLGGQMWSNADQWIEWNFTVEKSGFYALSSHFKQAYKEGRGCCRSIYIDGKLPFKEADSWLFPYSTTWQSGFFADKTETPYKIYLEKGEHTLRLAVSMGDYSEVIQNASNLLNELNNVYRKIIAVTGVNPDPYRDYRFDRSIPETIERMKDLSARLKALEQGIVKIEGNASSLVDVKRLYTNLDLMLRDTDKISVRLSTFKDNIASFGTWINEQRGQPLQLDYVRFGAPDAELLQGEAGFFKLVTHYFCNFLSSFVMDYSKVGQTEIESDKSITVWMTTSQDQAQILRQIASTYFTPKTNIAVQVQLVSTTALLPSILAHKGPDVVLGVAQTDVNNLALRNAAENLYDYIDGEFLTSQFHDYSLNVFKFRDGLYALPETQTWPMLFYRTDILRELNIAPSDLTRWDLILETVLPKMKKSALSFGLLPTVDNFLTFLYQRGGDLYVNDMKSSGLSSSAAVESMKLFSTLYKEYGFALSFDFANRFRNGEMPIAVVDFSMYNTLTLFAPEIKNLWGMLPVPGTADSEGNINHTTVTRATGSVIMSDSENKQAAGDFLMWWCSADAQDMFGKRLEAVVGAAARYNSANKNAMKAVKWNKDMKDSMLYQQEHLKEYSEVPGGYFTERLFNFAFRNIVYDNDEVRKTMSDMADDIDIELANKREEYDLK